MNQAENPTAGLAAGTRFSGLDRVRASFPTLYETAAFEAMLNAVERYPMPQCDPETRHDAQQVVTDWLCNGNEEIMWLSGAPGVGKSAVVQTVCETLEGSANNPIRAVHFFGRGQGRREKLFYFPATVAYQLALANDLYRTLLDTTINYNPHIFTQAFGPQFRKLVIGPTATTAGVPSFQTPITVVIDALDEIDNIGDQVALLEVAFSAATKNGMRFLIASRPEQDIDAFFHRHDVRPHVHHVRLDEETFKTSRDIFIFLKKGFTRIRQSRPWFFPRDGLLDSDPWPGITILRQLTSYSDGQFIFSHLIIESIEADRATPPHEQLQSILEHTAVKTFSKLDTLYHQILSRCLQGTASTPDRHKAWLMGVLRVIICWPEELPIAGIADVLGEETFVVENVIRGPMRCLFKVKDDGKGSHVSLCHKSLRDCVVNRTRAGEFFIGHGLEQSDDPILSTRYALYRGILSRCLRGPPSERERNKALSTSILRIMIFWPGMPVASFADITGVLDEEISVLEGVIRGPMCRLFSISNYNVRLCDKSLQGCLLNRSSAGEFFIGSDDPNISILDVLYHDILSRSLRGPLSQRQRNKALLMGILRVIICWPRRLSIAVIANILDEEEFAVADVLLGPMRSLFSVSSAEFGIDLYASSLQDHVLNRSRAGEFFVGSDDPKISILDVLYHDILSRSLRGPPSQRQRNKTRLMGILRAIIWWPEELSIAGIADVLDEEESVVEDVIQGPMCSLFMISHPYVMLFHNSLGDFVLSPSRSGEFFISSHEPDELFIEILSRPPPTDRRHSFPPHLLVEVLQYIQACNSLHTIDSTLDGIASHLNADPGIVRRVLHGPHRALFCHFFPEDAKYTFAMGTIGEFLADPSRSGRWSIPYSRAADAVVARTLSTPPP